MYVFTNQVAKQDTSGAGMIETMLAEIRRVVWKVPRGKVATYGAVARAAGFPGRARQVVWALRDAEPGLPWHRIVGAGGRILLPGESGLDQRLRLRQEGVEFERDRVALKSFEHDFKPQRAPRKMRRPASG
jgi:methylated-DNA-protein-cysteine methyltransferase-like protein